MLDRMLEYVCHIGKILYNLLQTLCQIECQNICQRKCQNICQIECQIKKG